MNKFKIVALLLLSFVNVSTFNSFAYLNETDIDTSYSKMVLDMDFDNNEATNNINNTNYNLSSSLDGRFSSSIKGNGFESNSSKINIPFRELVVRTLLNLSPQ